MNASIALLCLELMVAAPTPGRAELFEALADVAALESQARIRGAERAGRLGHPLAIGPLLGLLQAPEAAVRAAAARALGEIGVPRSSEDLTLVLSALMRTLRDPDDGTAIAAIEALGRFPFPGVRGRFEVMAADPKLSEPVRAAAREMLVAPASEEARRRLEQWLEVSRAEALATRNSPAASWKPPPQTRWGVEADGVLLHARNLLDPDRSLHLAAIRALAAWPDHREALPFLSRALTEAEPASRIAAIRGLARIEGAETALVRVIDDPQLAVRRAVIAALHSRRGAPIARAVAARLLVESDQGLRAKLGSTLAAQSDPDLLAALDGLVMDDRLRIEAQRVIAARTGADFAALLASWLTECEQPACRRALARQLAKRPDSETLGPLLGVLARTAPRSDSRSRLLEVLDAKKDPRIAPALLDLIASGNGDSSLLPLLSLQDSAVVEQGLIALLDSDRPAVVDLALEGLRAHRSAEVTAALSRVLHRDPGAGAAFELLLQQPEEHRVAPLIALLDSEDHDTRHATILRALARSRSPELARSSLEVSLEQPELAPLAIDVLSQQEPEAATEALAVLARAEPIEERERARAIRLLAELAPGSAVERIRPLAHAPSVEVKMAARNTLHQLAPETFPAWDPYGRIPLVIESAGFGAAMMLIAAEIADARLSPAFTAGAGAVLGAATPYLLTRKQDVSLGDAGYFGTTALWATLGGWGLGGALGLDERGTRWATLGGEALGLGVAALTLRDVEWGLGEVTLANFTALEAGATSVALGSLLSTGGTAQDAGYTMLLAGGLATVPMVLFGRQLEVGEDLGLIVTAMAHGAWLGLWAPAVFSGEALDGSDALAGAIAGQGLGYLAGLMIAQVADFSGERALASGAGLAIGAAIGGGLGLSVPSWSGSTLHYGLIQAGSASGALALGLLADRLELRGNDLLLVSLSTLGGALAAAQLEVRAAEDTFGEPSFGGSLLLGAGLGTAGGLLLSQLVDASDREVGRSLLGGAIFAASGAGFSRLAGLGVHPRSILTGVSAAAGLALTAPIAEELELGPTNLGFAGIAALAGASWASQLPAYWHDDGEFLPSNEVGGGILFGAAFSSIAAITASQLLELEAKDLALSAGGAVAGSAMGLGLGMLLPGLDRRTEVALLHGAGLAAFAGATALGASRTGPSTSGRGFAEVAGHTTLLAAHGALHGALIPYTWRDDRVPARETGGGLMLGAGLGATGGYALARLLDRPLDGGDLIEASLFSLAADGLGAGAGWVAGDGRLSAGLVQGLGLAALGAGLALSPSTTWDAGDVAPIATSIGLFSWFGGWLPVALHGDDERVGAGVLAGASLGALAGAAYAQLTDAHHEAELGGFAIAGSGLGAGLAMVLPGVENQGRAALIEAAGAGALAAGLAAAPSTRYDAGDLALIAASTSLGAFHGGLAPPGFGDGSEGKIGGGMLLGASGGYLTGIALSQLLEVDPGDVLEAALLSGAASAFGGGLVSSLDGVSGRAAPLAISAAGLAGLGIASWLAPGTEYTRNDLSLLATLSAAGAVHGGAAPRIWNRSGEPRVLGGALLGSATGLLAGAALSQGLELEPADQAEAIFYDLAGSAAGAGLSLLIGGFTPGGQLALIQGAGLAALAGGLSLAPSTSFSDRDRGLMAYGTLLGAWHGGWLGPLFDEASAGRRSGGGALLGAGAGFLTSALLSSSMEISGDDQLESGLTWAYGTAIGGGLMLALDADRRLETGILQLAGLAGAAGGLYFGGNSDFDDADRLLVATGLALGAWHGSTVPVLTGASGAPVEDRIGGALAGAGLLGLGAHLLGQYTDYELSDVGEIALISTLGNAVGHGVGMMIPRADARLRLGLIDGAGLGAAAAAAYFARDLSFEPDDVLNYGLFATLGATAGAFTPAYWNGPRLGDVPGGQAAGGIMAGAGAGLASAAILDRAWTLTGDRREAIAVGALAGGLTGGGLGLALSRDDRLAAGLVQGLMLAGGIGVGATADPLSLDLGSMAVGAAYVGYLTWHEVGLSLLLDGTDRQAAGATLATLGVGALSGIYLVPKLQLKMEQALMLFAGSVWGSWIGGWGGAILEDAIGDLDGRRSTGLVLLTTVLGSDIGLGVSGLVISGLLDVEPARFAVINLCGLGGMMVGMLAAGFAQEEPLKAGNVLGSLGGLIAGTIVTSFFDFSDKPSPYDPPASQLAVHEARSGGGPLFSVEHWMPTVSVEPTEDGERYTVGIVGLFK